MPWFLIAKLRGIVGDHFFQITETGHAAWLMWYIHISGCSTLSTFCSACCSFAGKEARHANLCEPGGNAAQPPQRKRPCQSLLGGLNRCQAGTAHSSWHFKLGSSSAHQLGIGGESHWFTAAIYHLSTRRKLPFLIIQNVTGFSINHFWSTTIWTC